VRKWTDVARRARRVARRGFGVPPVGGLEGCAKMLRVEWWREVRRWLRIVWRSSRGRWVQRLSAGGGGVAGGKLEGELGMVMSLRRLCRVSTSGVSSWEVDSSSWSIASWLVLFMMISRPVSILINQSIIFLSTPDDESNGGCNDEDVVDYLSTQGRNFE